MNTQTVSLPISYSTALYIYGSDASYINNEGHVGVVFVDLSTIQTKRGGNTCNLYWLTVGY